MLANTLPFFELFTAEYTVCSDNWYVNLVGDRYQTVASRYVKAANKATKWQREGFKKGIFRIFQNPPTPLAKCGKNRNNMV